MRSKITGSFVWAAALPAIWVFTNASAQTEQPLHLADEMKATSASASIGGRKMTYQAEAGVMVVHLRDPLDDDPPLLAQGEKLPPQSPEVSMSYVAYFQ